METTPQLTKGQQVMSSRNNGDPEAIAALQQVFANAFDEIDKWVGAKLGPEYKPGVYNAEQADIHRLAATAKTNLETAQMYAVKAVTR